MDAPLTRADQMKKKQEHPAKRTPIQEKYKYFVLFFVSSTILMSWSQFIEALLIHQYNEAFALEFITTHNSNTCYGMLCVFAFIAIGIWLNERYSCTLYVYIYSRNIVSTCTDFPSVRMGKSTTSESVNGNRLHSTH